jgi:hypothetical protein
MLIIVCNDIKLVLNRFYLSIFIYFQLIKGSQFILCLNDIHSSYFLLSIA